VSESAPGFKDNSRRRFLKGLTATPVAAFAGEGLLAQTAKKPESNAAAAPQRQREAAPFPPPGKKFVAIQIGARSFVDEGVDQCLDTLREKGGVNVVMATVFTYGTGLAGRQVRGEPLPDHGAQEYDRIHGGSYAKVHPEFYEESVVKDIRAPELGDFDVLADVIPKAKAKGMQTYALFEEAYNPRLMPNFEKVCEVDVYGRLGRDTCFNNPQARALLTSMVSDWVTSNEIDGLMWESERQGPLNSTLGAHFGTLGPRRSICCSRMTPAISIWATHSAERNTGMAFCRIFWCICRKRLRWRATMCRAMRLRTALAGQVLR